MELYAAEVHAIGVVARTLTDRIARLHGVVHQYGAAVGEVQQNVPGHFTVDVAVNVLLLASL